LYLGNQTKTQEKLIFTKQHFTRSSIQCDGNIICFEIIMTKFYLDGLIIFHTPNRSNLALIKLTNKTNISIDINQITEFSIHTHAKRNDSFD